MKSTDYWRAAPWDPSRGKIALHESLHAAVAQLLGGEAYTIAVNKESGWARTTNQWPWQDIAVWLAPALISDMSVVDEKYIKRQSSRQRGYAWGWLKKNRRRIMRLAYKIRAQIGAGVGKLEWNPETTRWKWKRRKKR